MGSKVETQQTWKRRPSEIRGYERAMYMTLGNGDYLRIDYNLGENMVRLYTEIVEEQGTSYFSVIRNGRINVEKSSGKSTKIADRLKERADDFSTLPNEEVLKLINNNYGISSSNMSDKKSKKEQFESEREEVKRRYFKSEDEDAPSIRTTIYKGISLRRFELIDFLDIAAGIFIAAVFFFVSQYNLQMTGVVAAVWGIVLGVFDILLRGREPSFLKILFFLLIGTWGYIYSYLYL